MHASIIIPLYNRAHLIAETLDAVARQTLQPEEIIIIDDGSRDDSKMIAESYSGRLPGLTVVAQTNAGPGAARNRAMAMAAGDWLVFLDSDDIPMPDKLANLAAAVDAGPDVDFIHHDRRYLFPEGTERIGSNYPADLMEDINHLFSGFFIKTSTVAVSRDLVNRTSARFAEDIQTCEDYEFFWQVLSAQPKVKYLQSADTCIRETEGSLTRRDNAREISRDNVLVASRIMARGLDARLCASLKQARYRAAQELLRSSRTGASRFLADVAWLAKYLGGGWAFRAAVSILASR
ncbi:MAG: glycosyltransferase family 2 protein [Pacificimonas sp.]